jgi:hypothetical protein
MIPFNFKDFCAILLGTLYYAQKSIKLQEKRCESTKIGKFNFVFPEQDFFNFLSCTTSPIWYIRSLSFEQFLGKNLHIVLVLPGKQSNSTFNGLKMEACGIFPGIPASFLKVKFCRRSSCFDLHIKNIRTT